MTGSTAFVCVEDLRKDFVTGAGLFSRSTVTAVAGVSFDIAHGEVLSLVGESGSGKSTVGRMLVGLTPATSGQIAIDGRHVGAMSRNERKELWRSVQMIFQDPYSSLNPRMTIRDALAEPLRNFAIASGPEADRRIREVLDLCGLPARAMSLYPREFSGGQRQRIGIARALITRPTLIVADEPVSALDVSIQAQIINLLQDLQSAYGLSYLFISHDLAVVRHISTRVAVMYLGRIVEIAQAGELYARPLHPYTQLLLRSVPIPDPEKEAKRARPPIRDAGPSAADAGRGCPFSARCPRAAFPICGETPPPLETKITESRTASHLAACHFPSPLSA